MSELARMLLLSVCILWVLAANLCLSSASSLPELSTSSFRLRTVVRSFNNLINSRYTIEENYSNEQSRGVIAYELTSRDWLLPDRKLPELEPIAERGTLFVDSSVAAILSHPDGARPCEFLSDFDVLFKILGLDFFDVQSKKQPYMIGPARWLDYVKENRDHFKLVGLAEAGEQEHSSTVSYETNLVAADGQALIVGADFRVTSLAENSHQALPARVTLRHGKSYFELEFGQPELLSNYYDRIEANQADLAFDQFLLEPLSGCGEVLLKRKLAANTISDLFRGSSQSIVAHSARYSFKGQVEISGLAREAQNYMTFVALEPGLGLMRVDANESSGDVFQSRQIFDFHANTQYYCLEQTRGQRFLVNHLQELGGQQAGCLQAKITSLNGDKFSAGRLLLGANQFVYLGRAKVRGIRARVYEAFDSDFPVWLESSIVYRKGAENKTWSPAHDIGGDFNGEANKLVTLVFVTDHSDGPASLLLVEVHRVDSSYRATFERRSIEVFDFVWQIEKVDSFSLAQSSALSAPVNEARVSLLLASNSPVLSQKMAHFREQHTDRNLALEAGVARALEASTSMISDFESKLVETKTSGGNQENLQLVVSFEYAEYAFDQIFLERLGRGRRILGKSWYLLTISLVQCAFLAGQPRLDRQYFAYDLRERFCYVGTQLENDKEIPFQMDEEHGDLEIFRLRLETTKTPSSFLSQRTNPHTDDIKQYHIGLKLDLEVDGEQIPFTLSRLIIHDKQSSGEIEDGISSIDKIDGFGLREEAKINEKLAPIPLNSTFTNPLGKGSGERQELAEMSLATCESTCSADLTCKAYSFCFRAAETECILSKLSFQSHSLLATIRALSAGNASTFELNLALDERNEQDYLVGNKAEAKQRNVTITLVRRHNCAIYNKKYVDYFTISRKTKYGLANKSVMTVADIEQCSAVCAQINFRIIRGHYSRLAETLVGLYGGLNEADLAVEKNVDLGYLGRFHFREELWSSLCDKFIYIDRNDWITQSQEVRDILARSVKMTAEQTAGLPPELVNNTNSLNYCAIPSDSLRRRDEQREPSAEAEKRHMVYLGESLKVIEAQFKMENLFEETNGVSLVKSKMTELERKGFEDVAYNQVLSEQTIQVLLGFVKRSENNQKSLELDRASCARICLTNSERLWPSCKSFDIVVTREAMQGNIEVWCYLNSASLNELISSDRSDLIETSMKSNKAGRQIVERRHYEPRAGFVLEMETLGSESEFLRIFKRIPLSFGTASVVALYTLILFAATLSGLYLGAYLADTYGEQRYGTRANSISGAAVIDLPDLADQ